MHRVVAVVDEDKRPWKRSRTWERSQERVIALAASNVASIHFFMTQKVNKKLEDAVICGAANATNNNEQTTRPGGAGMSSGGDGSDYSTIILSIRSKQSSQSGVMGDFLSSKNYKFHLSQINDIMRRYHPDGTGFPHTSSFDGGI